MSDDNNQNDPAYDDDNNDPVDIDEQDKNAGIYPNPNPDDNNVAEVDLAKQEKIAEESQWED